MARISLTTAGQVRKAIKTCKQVKVQARFGTSETWVKISKADAKFLLEGYADDDVPGRDHGTDDFGDLNNGTLYLG